MIMVTIPCFVAWITLHFAQSINTLYIVSIIMGLCTGLTEAPLHSYIGEIAEPHLRGTLSSISTSAALIGTNIFFSTGISMNIHENANQGHKVKTQNRAIFSLFFFFKIKSLIHTYQESTSAH